MKINKGNLTYNGVRKPKGGSTHALPIHMNYILQQEETPITDPTGRDIPGNPNKKCFYFNYHSRRKIFLLAQQQAQPMGTIATQPMSSHHHPKLSLSSNGLSVQNTFTQLPHLFSIK